MIPGEGTVINKPASSGGTGKTSEINQTNRCFARLGAGSIGGHNDFSGPSTGDFVNMLMPNQAHLRFSYLPQDINAEKTLD